MVCHLFLSSRQQGALLSHVGVVALLSSKNNGKIHAKRGKTPTNRPQRHYNKLLYHMYRLYIRIIYIHYRSIYLCSSSAGSGRTALDSCHSATSPPGTARPIEKIKTFSSDVPQHAHNKFRFCQAIDLKCQDTGQRVKKARIPLVVSKNAHGTVGNPRKYSPLYYQILYLVVMSRGCCQQHTHDTKHKLK